MWVKCNAKTIFLDLSEHFLNLGNIEDEYLKTIVSNTRFTELVNLLPSKEIISDIQEAFTILDVQGKGSIGVRDVKVTLRALGIEPTAKKVKKLIDKATSSSKGAGDLSREDYIKIIVHVINDIDSDEQVLKSFLAIDIKNAGCITTKELTEIAKQLKIDISFEEIEEMVNYADTDNDGKVTLEEFMDAGRKVF